MTAVDNVDLAEGLTVRDVERLARWAANKGPRWLQEDMVAEASLRILEAVDAGQHHGFGEIAYRGAAKAMREAAFQAGGRQSRRALEANFESVVLHDPTSRTTLTRLYTRTRGTEGSSVSEARSDSDDERLGPVLDRLVALLVERGVHGPSLIEALYVLTDAAMASPPGRRTTAGSTQRSRALDVPAARMAECSGLDIAQCAALKVLVVGERPRNGVPRPDSDGLLVRVHRGEDPWSDPRTQRLVDQVVHPGPRLVRPWSRPVTSDDLAPGTAA